MSIWSLFLWNHKEEYEDLRKREENIKKNPKEFFLNSSYEEELKGFFKETWNKYTLDLLILREEYSELFKKINSFLKKNKEKERGNLWEKESLKSDVYLLKSKIEEIEEDSKKKTNKILSYSNEITKLKKSLRESDKWTKLLEKWFSDLWETNTTLINTIIKYEKRLKEIEKNINKIVENKIEDRVSDIKSQMALQYEKLLKEDTKELQLLISNFESQIKELEYQLTKKNEDLSSFSFESRQKIFNLTDLLATKDKEIEDLKQQKKYENIDKIAEKEKLKEENTKLKEENTELKEKNKDLEQQIYKNHTKQQKKLSEKDLEIARLKKIIETERQKNIKSDWEIEAYKEMLKNQNPTIVKNYH